MDSLRILSLGRNLLKKIENVEAVADTLQELWLSYNQIEKLVCGPGELGVWPGHPLSMRIRADATSLALATTLPPHTERRGEAGAAARALPVQQPHQGLE
jgi:hypothetical protein